MSRINIKVPVHDSKRRIAWTRISGNLNLTAWAATPRTERTNRAMAQMSEKLLREGGSSFGVGYSSINGFVHFGRNRLNSGEIRRMCDTVIMTIIIPGMAERYGKAHGENRPFGESCHGVNINGRRLHHTDYEKRRISKLTQIEWQLVVLGKATPLSVRPTDTTCCKL